MSTERRPTLARLATGIAEKFAITPKQKSQAQMGVALENRRYTHRQHVYAGTVDPVTRAKRRARNKAARQARAMHRRRA